LGSGQLSLGKLHMFFTLYRGCEAESLDWASLILIVIAVVVVLALIGYFVSIYNRFFSLRNSAEATLGQVRVAMKKRLDMIEQLVDSVKSYAKFEREVFEKITNMRTSVFKVGPEGLRDLDRESRSILGNVLAVAENYPDLKANQNFLGLQDELAGTENRISVERMRYNEAVEGYNRAARAFPGILFVRLFGFDSEKEYFRATEGSASPPAVQF